MSMFKLNVVDLIAVQMRNVRRYMYKSFSDTQILQQHNLKNLQNLINVEPAYYHR